MNKHILFFIVALLCSLQPMAQSIAETLPYSCNFEDGVQNANWTIANTRGGNRWVIGNCENGGNCLFVSNDNGATNYYSTDDASVSMAYIPITIPQLQLYVLEFDWRSRGEADDFIRVALVPTSVSLDLASGSSYDYVNTLPANWIALDDGAKYLHNNWTHELITTTVDHGNYWLVVLWANNGFAGMQPPAAVDNISLKAVKCPGAENLSAYSTTTSTAEVHWDPSQASEWMVEYGLPGFTQGNGTTISTTTNACTLTGLSAAQKYDIYVTSICNLEDTGIASMTSVVTSCYDDGFQMFPYNEGFESGLTCWNETVLSNSRHWRLDSALYNHQPPFEGSRMIIFDDQTHDGASARMESPIINLEATQTAMMTFAHLQPSWGSDQDHLSVAYRVHPDSSWVTLQEWTENITQWQIDTVWLPNNTSTYQVAFIAWSDYGRGVAIDDITIYGRRACHMPQIISATSDETSFSLQWSNVGERYEVAIKQSGSLIWHNSIELTDTAYTFFGLQPGTTYNYRARTLCDDGTSDWVEGSVTTSEVIEDPECRTPSGIKVSSTLLGILISWNDDPGVEFWDVIYCPIGQTMGSNIIQETRNHQFTLTDYKELSYYGVSVRAKCTNGHYSSWSELKRFKTPGHTLGIADPENSVVRIYPNPARTRVTIELDNETITGTISFEISDMMGRTLKTERIHSTHTTLDLQGMAKGVYLVKVISDNEMIHLSKLVIE